MSLRLLLLPALAGLVGAPSAQSCRTQSVGLFGRTAAAETAYVLWTAAETPHTWLLDRHGREVHRTPEPSTEPRSRAVRTSRL